MEESVSPDKSSLEKLRIDRNDVSEPRRWPWIVAITAALIICGGGLGLWWLTAQSPVPVETAVAREVALGGQRTVLNASGYVTARRQATVSSKVTGKVTEVLIEEGMEVETGEILARLDTANVRASYELAEAQLKAARASLVETEVRLREAGLDLHRITRLVEEKVASQAELDRAQAEADSLRAHLVRQNQDVAVADRERALWRQQLEDTIIRAPFAGVVVTKDAQPGEMISPVSAGGGFTRTGIGTIVDMSSLEIEVDVNESYINRVAPDQPVTATLDAYPDWQIPAHVIAIVPTADRQRATVRVRIGFASLDPRILPDMGVKVAFQEVIEETGRSTGVMVPSAAVRQQNEQEIVLVLSGGRIERRAVSTRPGDNGSTLVISGLAAGETVVVNGPAELADGDRAQEVG
jgi:RND family efflux transporter MFP subunit